VRAAIRKIFRSNLAIKDGERVLVITDEGKREIARQFLETAEELGHGVELATVPIPEVHGVEPPAAVAGSMLAADVILIVTTRSLSHTRARAEATRKGARIATMAGVTEDILRRFSQVDLLQMKARTNMYADILDRGEAVLLTSKRGTDLAFSIAGRIAHGRKASIFDRPGYWGNIPCGEAFIAPIEDSVNGTLVIDASIAGIGLVDGDVTFHIRSGKVVELEGGSAARRFEALLDDSRKRQVAEFGIGTNDKAEITGTTLEDEKALGTCHVAFGNNAFFGGENPVGFHMDCVMRAPTIVVDGRVIMGD
jgi:leucyl aminopeptidase (aminopeptidase T)